MKPAKPMGNQDQAGLVKIRRALISVSDKTGIVDFARDLRRFDIEIISTGGTAKTLRDGGIEVRDIAEITGFPEMMDGRVKTLHPHIHAALLAVRDNREHMKALGEHHIEPIDMVVANLYPFEKTIRRKGVTLDEAIEQIDIGGPAMIRSAAKNFQDVAVVATPESYATIKDELAERNGSLSLQTRGQLAAAAFDVTTVYDFTVEMYLKERFAPEEFTSIMDEVNDYTRDYFDNDGEGRADSDEETEDEEPAAGSNHYSLFCQKIEDLRYGENPHQVAALYNLVYEDERGVHSDHESANGSSGIAHAELLLSGREMSFNNYVDADAAWQLVCDFDQTVCAIIKHTNPSGVATGPSPAEAYRRALACDPVSAFGGIVAFNRTMDEAAARAAAEIFTEVIIAPDFADDALAVLRSKKNLRVLQAGEPQRSEGLEYKQISGGMLAQTRNTHRLNRTDLKVVTQRAPSEKEVEDLLFAWTVCKHTKSNAIVYARDGQMIGVGAGQMSRVDSVRIGAMRAQLPLAGSVVASDAFFPFRDGVEEAAKHGITAIIQPGGSVRDAEIIAAANEHGLAMVFTGIRHFKH
jgi:phosphoribosylaminoimidazolecarboxamide formyltransferase/IMP cyclohydrolase